MIKKIIFGGQTGADIGDIDAAIECGVEYTTYGNYNVYLPLEHWIFH